LEALYRSNVDVFALLKVIWQKLQ